VSDPPMTPLKSVIVDISKPMPGGRMCKDASVGTMLKF